MSAESSAKERSVRRTPSGALAGVGFKKKSVEEISEASSPVGVGEERVDSACSPRCEAGGKMRPRNEKKPA